MTLITTRNIHAHSGKGLMDRQGGDDGMVLDCIEIRFVDVRG